MSQIARRARDLVAIADRLDKTAADSRATFTDATRPNFEHHVVAAFMREAKRLESQASELDARMERALCLLEGLFDKCP